MSAIREQVAEAIAAKIKAAEPVLDSLDSPIEVLAAPPSHLVDYPAAAILMDSFPWVPTQDDELELGVDQDGNPVLVGGGGGDGTGAVAVLDGNPATGPATYLAHVGSIRARGRIWAGARHAPQREEVEEAIGRVFMQDGLAPGRLLVDVRLTVGGHLLPWLVYATVFVKSAEWKDEFAFEERLYTFMNITVDMPILIDRTSPFAAQLLLELGASDRILPTTYTEQVSVAGDGSVAIYP